MRLHPEVLPLVVQEAAHGERRGRQQCEAHGDLQRHGRVAAPDPAAALAHVLVAALQFLFDGNAHGAAQGNKREGESRQRRDGDGKEQHMPVWRKAGIDPGPCCQNPRCSHGQRPTQHAPGAHQQHAFGKQLPEDARGSRAYSHAHRELSLANAVPGYDQQRHVGACDQKNQPDQGHHDFE